MTAKQSIDATRVLLSGKALAFQASYAGSIPATRFERVWGYCGILSSPTVFSVRAQLTPVWRYRACAFARLFPGAGVGSSNVLACLKAASPYPAESRPARSNSCHKGLSSLLCLRILQSRVVAAGGPNAIHRV